MAQPQQLTLAEMVKLQRRAWTFFHNQQIISQEEGIRDQIQFLLQWRGKQGNLEVQCSYRQVYGYDRGQGQQFPNVMKNLKIFSLVSSIIHIKLLEIYWNQYINQNLTYLSDGVMTTSVVVCCIFLSRNDLLWVIQLTVCS